MELAVVTGSIALGAAIVRAIVVLHKVGRVMDQFTGYPAGPGYPAQRGVIERLLDIENEIIVLKMEVQERE